LHLKVNFGIAAAPFIPLKPNFLGLIDAAIAVAAKLTDVCLWHKADITIALNHVRFWG